MGRTEGLERLLGHTSRHGLGLHAIVALLTCSLLAGCSPDGSGTQALISSSTPHRVVMKIINNACGSEDVSDAEDEETGAVKGLTKVLNGFGIPYSQGTEEYSATPQPITDDSEEANKNRGIGYCGSEAHYLSSMREPSMHISEHEEAGYEDGNGGSPFAGLLTPEEEEYGVTMRWEYTHIPGYKDFMEGNGSGHMQYVAIHCLQTDKWCICCPYDWGPRANPILGSATPGWGRIGGATPAATEALGFYGQGDCPEVTKCEFWWVENSSQVKCGPVSDLSELTGGSTSSSSSSPRASVSVGIATAVTSSLTATHSERVSVAPANPASFVNVDEVTAWSHGNLPADKVRYIVLHDSDAGTYDAENIIHARAGGTSMSHFVIDREGRTFACVPIGRIARHAGASEAGANAKFSITQERDDLVGIGTSGDHAMDAWSIGIELVHEHGTDGYPAAQLNALDRLVSYIDAQTSSEPTVIDHRTWNPSARDCSDDFPLEGYQTSRNHLGVTSESEAIAMGEADACSDSAGLDDEDAVGAEEIAKAAVRLAGTATPVPPIPGGETERPTDARLAAYVSAHDEYLPDDVFWASCDRAAATAIRASGADPDFCVGPCTAIADYCGRSSLWEQSGTWRTGDSASELEPGDVLVCSSHVKIYVGNEAVRERFPDSKANMYSGSRNEHQPWCYREEQSSDSRDYAIFRLSSKSSSNPSLGVRTSSATGSALGMQVAWLAVQMAATGAAGDTMPNHLQCYPGMTQWGKIDDARLENCYAIHDATLGAHGGNNAIASCTQTAVACMSAVVDMDMSSMAVTSASGHPKGCLEYMHSEQNGIFEQVLNPTVDDMQPGDMLCNSTHDAIWVGVEMAQTKFPGTNCNVYEASYNSYRYGGMSVWNDVAGYEVWRPIKHNDASQFEDLDYVSLIKNPSCDPPNGKGISSRDDATDPLDDISVSVTRA